MFWLCLKECTERTVPSALQELSAFDSGNNRKWDPDLPQYHHLTGAFVFAHSGRPIPLCVVSVFNLKM